MCLKLAFENNLLIEICHCCRKLDTNIRVLEKNEDIDQSPWGKVKYLRTGCKVFHAQQPGPPKGSQQKMVGTEMFIKKLNLKQGNVCSQGPLTRTFP